MQSSLHRLDLGSIENDASYINRFTRNSVIAELRSRYEDQYYNNSGKRLEFR